jgi:hypothetical protein
MFSGFFHVQSKTNAILVAVFVPAPRHLIQALAEGTFVVFFFVQLPNFPASYPDIHSLLLLWTNML